MLPRCVLCHRLSRTTTRHVFYCSTRNLLRPIKPSSIMGPPCMLPHGRRLAHSQLEGGSRALQWVRDKLVVLGMLGVFASGCYVYRELFGPSIEEQYDLLVAHKGARVHDKFHEKDVRKRAAAAGYLPAQLAEANALLGQDRKQAMELLQICAEKGDGEASLFLGLLLDDDTNDTKTSATDVQYKQLRLEQTRLQHLEKAAQKCCNAAVSAHANVAMAHMAVLVPALCPTTKSSSSPTVKLSSSPARSLDYYESALKELIEESLKLMMSVVESGLSAGIESVTGDMKGAKQDIMQLQVTSAADRLCDAPGKAIVAASEATVKPSSVTMRELEAKAGASDTQAMLQLSFVELARNREAKAVKYLRRVIELGVAKDYAKIHGHLARMYLILHYENEPGKRVNELCNFAKASPWAAHCFVFNRVIKGSLQREEDREALNTTLRVLEQAASNGSTIAKNFLKPNQILDESVGVCVYEIYLAQKSQSGLVALSESIREGRDFHLRDVHLADALLVSLDKAP